MITDWLKQHSINWLFTNSLYNSLIFAIYVIRFKWLVFSFDFAKLVFLFDISKRFLLKDVKRNEIKMMFIIGYVGDYTPKFHPCPSKVLYLFWQCKVTKKFWIMQIFGQLFFLKDVKNFLCLLYWLFLFLSILSLFF